MMVWRTIDNLFPKLDAPSARWCSRCATSPARGRPRRQLPASRRRDRGQGGAGAPAQRDPQSSAASPRPRRQHPDRWPRVRSPRPSRLSVRHAYCRKIAARRGLSEMDLRANTSITVLRACRGRPHQSPQGNTARYSTIEQLSSAPTPPQLVGKLSGGNQQKASSASGWRPARVLIVDEPKRGIDVGARPRSTR